MTKVMVTYPHANTVSQSFCWSLLNMDRKHVTEILPTRGYPGTGLIIARNAAVEIFLRSDNEWLWTLDSDIGFEPDTLDRLLWHANGGYQVISGLYSTILETGSLYLDGSQSYKEYKLALQETPDGKFMQYDEYEGAMEVDGVGAGCLLVHRAVFEGWPENTWYDTCQGLGEDLSFCVKVRNLGYKILCDTDVKVSHHKQVWLRG